MNPPVPPHEGKPSSDFPEAVLQSACSISRKILIRNGAHPHICVLWKDDYHETMILLFTNEQQKRAEYLRVQKQAKVMNADFVLAIAEAVEMNHVTQGMRDVLTIHMYGPNRDVMTVCPFTRRGKTVYCGEWERKDDAISALLMSWWDVKIN